MAFLKSKISKMVHLLDKVTMAH